MTSLWVRVAAAMVDIGARIVRQEDRAAWQEQWRAELLAAASVLLAARFGAWRIVRMAAGSWLDAFAMRRYPPANRPRGRKVPVFDGFGRDLRRTVRALTASPGLALGIVGSLGLGIAANATAFSLLQVFFFRPFPHVVDQESLLNACIGECRISLDEVERLRTATRDVVDLSVLHPVDVGVTVDRRSETRRGALVSAGYFHVLGVAPALGRFFVDGDETAAWRAPAAVISYALWQTAFERDPSAVGRVVQINGADVRIIGVTPKGFVGVRKGKYGTDVWIPLTLSDAAVRDERGRTGLASLGWSPWFDLVLRPKPGADRALVQARFESVASAFVRPSREEQKSPSRGASPVTVGLWPVVLNDIRSMAFEAVVFSTVPLLVLLIACVNAAMLLAARASRSTREWHLRLALGAARRHIVRHVLLEAAVLAAVAAASGFVATGLVLRWQERLIPLPVPIDWRVLVYTVGMAVFTTFVFGVAPAWSTARRTSPSFGQVTAYRSRNRLRGALIFVQAALSVALLVTGTQFLRTVTARAAEAGLDDPDRLVVVTLDASKLKYVAPQVELFYERLLSRARTLPRIRAAGVSTQHFVGNGSDRFNQVEVIEPAGADGQRQAALATEVQGDVFRALDLGLASGRFFTPEDSRGHARVVIVNAAFERNVIKGPAVGRTVKLAHLRPPPAGFEWRADEPLDLRIVGVVTTTGTYREDSRDRPYVYYPSTLDAGVGRRHLYLQYTDDVDSTADVRRLVASIDERVPTEIETARQIIDRARIEDRWIAQSMAALGVLGLVLASGGLFGLIAFLVSARARELGIRMALGAHPYQVLALVWAQAMRPVVIGLVIGGASAVCIGFVVRSRLYGVSVVDPVALAGAALVMLVTMTVASLLPSLRATRVDPASSLRDS